MPPTDSDVPQPPDRPGDRVSAGTNHYRPPWWPLALATAVVPVVLAALVTAVYGGTLETDLRNAAMMALADAGVGATSVTFDGRDAALSGVPPGRDQAALTAVLAVPGVRTAEVTSSRGPELAAQGPAAEQVERSRPPVLPVPQDDRVEVLPPDLEAVAAERAALQDEIDELFAVRPIHFEGDTAVLTAGCEETARRLAELLEASPGLRVLIGGHGSPGQEITEEVVRLSTDRAVAVRDELVQLGIAPDRVVAVGFGAGDSTDLPIEVAVL